MTPDLSPAERDALVAVFEERRAGVRSDDNNILAAVERIIAARVTEAADAREAEVRAESAPSMEPWGPFEMGGFEGCTDSNPEVCACAHDQQPTCHDCGQEIEPGETAWSRQWPCYETLPLDHRDQEWVVISWHDSCPDIRAALAPADNDGDAS